MLWYTRFSITFIVYNRTLIFGGPLQPLGEEPQRNYTESSTDLLRLYEHFLWLLLISAITYWKKRDSLNRAAIYRFTISIVYICACLLKIFFSNKKLRVDHTMGPLARRLAFNKRNQERKRPQPVTHPELNIADFFFFSFISHHLISHHLWLHRDP